MKKQRRTRFASRAGWASSGVAVRRREAVLSKITPFLALALALFGAIAIFMNNRIMAERLGERIAFFSAGLNMPDIGAIILRDYLLDRLELLSLDIGEISLPEREPTTAAHDPRPLYSLYQDEEYSNESPAANGFLVAPRIPEQYRGRIARVDFSPRNRDGAGYIQFGEGFIRNDTNHTAESIHNMLGRDFNLSFSAEEGPIVLIVHTHATESFERWDSDFYDTRTYWRSRDNNSNIVAVGATLAAALESRGIPIIHDTTHHDFPTFAGSYERAAETIQAYLEEYPTIRIVLDIHRDAIIRDDDTIVKPVTTINGRQAAQIMIISAADNGRLGVPNYPYNLRFAAHFQDHMEQAFPGLTRAIFFTYRRYNMHLTPGSLLVEIGSNANTIEEASFAAALAGDALADLILGKLEG